MPHLASCYWTDADGCAVISVAASPTGKLFATGSGDLRTRIWRSVLIGHFSFLYRPFVHLNSAFIPFSLSFGIVRGSSISASHCLLQLCLHFLWLRIPSQRS